VDGLKGMGMWANMGIGLRRGDLRRRGRGRGRMGEMRWGVGSVHLDADRRAGVLGWVA
jgi:hypothetical protein